MTYHVRDWVEIRREYLRQLAELEARLAASDQVQRLAELGNVTDDRGRGKRPMSIIVGFALDIVRGAREFRRSVDSIEQQRDAKATPTQEGQL